MEKIVKTQIELPKKVDKLLKLIKVEFDFENKSQAVEFVIEAFKGEFKSEIESKFADAMTPKHAKISKKRAKTIKQMDKEMDNW